MTSGLTWINPQLLGSSDPAWADSCPGENREAYSHTLRVHRVLNCEKPISRFKVAKLSRDSLGNGWWVASFLHEDEHCIG